MPASSDVLLYDRIGDSYTSIRRPDPRIARRIEQALGDATSVINVGAGTGAYEPEDRRVLAAEPSKVMIAQRAPHAAPVVQAWAEELPFEDGAFDAAMAIISDHLWQNRSRGLAEMRRVARKRVLVLNGHPVKADRLWFTRDYLPEFSI